MKKALGQTVRDLKREVNKKVLKVPGIEQKVLDATSNEAWGPHGSHLADIAQATKNYHEYQMIMAVLWKRINDTGKNWRHVYKALTVLDYLVANGSERVIDDIKEHGYQISALSSFQYIDSGGRDQGNNVRKKSQSLINLVNDKERIIEARQKAAANKDKFRSSVPGGMYRPGSHSNLGGYGDKYDYDRYEGRYGSRDEDQNGYGRDKEYGYRDDDRSSRYGDSNNRDGDRYGRDEERYGRDGYRDEDYQGRSRSVDGSQYGSRGRSSDRERAFDEDGQSSSRGSNARADDRFQDGSKGLDRKLSEQNIGAPPNYEDAVGESQNPVNNDRDGETPAVSTPAPASLSESNNPSHTTTGFRSSASPVHQEFQTFDEFDPRGSVSAFPPVGPTTATPTTSIATSAHTTTNGAEMDLLGSLSDSYSSNLLAIMPATSLSAEADAHANIGLATTFSTTQSATQPYENPFGETPFKAIPSTNDNSAPQLRQPTMNKSAEIFQPAAPNTGTAHNFGFEDSFTATTSFTAPSVPNIQTPSTNLQLLPQELSTSPTLENDILADILPPMGPTEVPPLQSSITASTGMPVPANSNMYGSFNPQSPFGEVADVGGGGYAPSQPQSLPENSHLNSGNFVPQQGSVNPTNPHILQHTPTGQPTQISSGNFLPQQGFGAPTQHTNGNFVTNHGSPPGPAPQSSNDVFSNMFSQAGSTVSTTSSAGPLALVPQASKDKFEPKSAVWADTLSRGLVNFNISGPKTNPLADIGVDFDALNRKDKRMEKPSTNPVMSTVTMGKAMGSGSGLGRGGAGSLRPAQNSMMGMGGRPAMGMGGGPGMNMGMGGGPGMNMGMGGGPGMNMGMGGGPGMNMGMGGRPGMNMGMGGYGSMNQQMGMGMGQGMQAQNGMAPGSGMQGGYNPMMGSGGYGPQQPYGGGYR